VIRSMCRLSLPLKY